MIVVIKLIFFFGKIFENLEKNNDNSKIQKKIQSLVVNLFEKYFFFVFERKNERFELIRDALYIYSNIKTKVKRTKLKMFKNIDIAITEYLGFLLNHHLMIFSKNYTIKDISIFEKKYFEKLSEFAFTYSPVISKFNLPKILVNLINIIEVTIYGISSSTSYNYFKYIFVDDKEISKLIAFLNEVLKKIIELDEIPKEYIQIFQKYLFVKLVNYFKDFKIYKFQLENPLDSKLIIFI